MSERLDVDPAVGLDAFHRLVRQRRTNLRMDRDRPVPDDLVAQLCELAVWAPNHKLTNPWRFAVFTGEGRTRLGEHFAREQAAAGETDPARIDKTCTKYRRAPAVLVVGSAADANPTRHAENRDAVAAGIAHLLLGATAAGLGSFWSSPPACPAPAVNELCGFGPDDVLVGVVYLGWLVGDVPATERAAARVRHVDA